MRAAFAGVVAVVACAGGACAPEIAPGTYLCGPEQLCPEGQACNGPDNICVHEGVAQPFACGDEYLDVPGDDTPAAGQPRGELACVSPPLQVLGCLVDGDPADFYRFSTPAGCPDVKVTATVAFPVAFASLGIQFAADGGAAAPVEMPCPSSRPVTEGYANRCFEMTLAPGASYAIGVAPDGAAACDGACAFNRYVLDFALATP